MSQTQQLFAERKERMDKASRLETPDRVPFAPLTGFYPTLAYGVSNYEYMVDPRNGIPGMLQYIKDLQPDAIFPPNAHCIPALETTGAEYIRWPGMTHGLGKDSSFQITDNTYVEDDEYEEFLRDPSHFQITKVIPRKFKHLGAFAGLNFQNTSEFGCFPNFVTLAQPEVKEAVFRAMKAGEEYAAYGAQFGELIGAQIEAGVPLLVDTFAIAPFDLWSDDFRGMINAVMDIHDRPEQLLRAVEYTTEVTIASALANAAATGAKRCFIPLHAGGDEFMSPADYEKFYWPGLKQLLLALIENGITPVPFCEGGYNSRLEIISDVPKGKVEYMFEKIDLKRAKETVGKVACIYGTMPNALLIYGTRQEVIDETKRQLDICAPGGGFIMDAAIVIDNAKKENMEAWMQTTIEYGKY